MFLIGLRRDRYIDPFGNQREDLPSIRCGRNKLVCRYLDDRCPVYNQHRCRKDSGCKDRLEYRQMVSKRSFGRFQLHSCSYSCRRVGNDRMDVQCIPWGKSKWPCGSRHGTRRQCRKRLCKGRHT